MGPDLAQDTAYDAVRALVALGGLDDRRIASDAIADVLTSAFPRGQSSRWHQLADEAEHHGVAPIIAPMISAIPSRQVPGMPETVRQTFVMLVRRHQRAALAREACIDRLIAAFETAALPMLLLKGAALAHSLYPRVGLRPMADIDLLIEPRNATAAIGIAQRLGYNFAADHGTRFAASLHHLPAATTTEAGFRISLELHENAMSPNQSDTLSLASLTAPPRRVHRASGRDGATLGHVDMLRHLTRHAFEPAKRIRLIHLLDLWRYQARFGEEIDWCDLAKRLPHVIVALLLIHYVFAEDHRRFERLGPLKLPAPEGAGMGMLPLSEIAASRAGIGTKLSALFNPPPWWLHGFYAVPPEHSLLACRMVRHPTILARWLTRRILARATWSIRPVRVLQ